MKTLPALCLTLLILMLNGRAQSPAPPSDASSAAIDTLREGIVSSFRKADINGILEHLDPDVVVTWQNGEVCRGREQVRAFHNRMMNGDGRVVRSVESNPEVLGRHVYGEWAVSWGNLRDHFILMDGSDLPFNSVFTAVIAKRGDRWLVTGFHVSVAAFDNPVLTMAVKKTARWAGLGGGAAGLLAGVAVAWWLRRRVAKA